MAARAGANAKGAAMNPFELAGAQWLTPQSGRASGERGSSQDASSRWLLELERAQWALRSRDSAAPAAARAAQRPGETSRPAAAAPRGAPRVEETEASPHAANPQQ